MNTRLIAEDLLRSFLASGGLVQTQAKVMGLEKGSVLAKISTDEAPVRIPARHTILATGKDTTAFETNTKVFISPLLVVYPALTDLNFVRMSPHMEETINHLCHRNNGLEYSLIGNAVYHDAQQGTGAVLERVRANMLGMAKRVFGDFDAKNTDLFFGYKTEVSSSSFIRNYLYHILDRGEYTLALPGKFSLCFSLAVNVCRHFGIEPVEQSRLVEPEAVRSLIEEPLHYQMAKRLAEQNQNRS